MTIDELQKDDLKRSVIYIDGAGETTPGHITSWNDRFIFVDYGNSCGRGVATTPSDLKFAYAPGEKS